MTDNTYGALPRKVQQAMRRLADVSGLTAVNALKAQSFNNVMNDDPDISMFVEHQAEQLMRQFAMTRPSRGMGLQSCIELVWALALFMDAEGLWQWMGTDDSKEGSL